MLLALQAFVSGVKDFMDRTYTLWMVVVLLGGLRVASMSASIHEGAPAIEHQMAPNLVQTALQSDI